MSRWPSRTTATPPPGDPCWCMLYDPQDADLARFPGGIVHVRCGRVFALYDPPPEADPVYLARRKAMRERKKAERQKALGMTNDTKQVA